MKRSYQYKHSTTSQCQRPKNLQNITLQPLSNFQEQEISQFQNTNTMSSETQSIMHFQEIVAKARKRIQNKSQLPHIQYNLKKIDEKSTFMTDLGINYPEQQLQEDNQIQIDDKFTFDDLGELRRMIRKTKRAVSSCGKDLQQLKTGVNNLSKNAYFLRSGIENNKTDKIKTNIYRKQ